MKLTAYAFLMLAAVAHCANYNCLSNASGNYDSAAIWNTCNGGIPNNGADTFTFTVSAGHTVTLPSGVEVTAGQSLAANTAQGTVANTGKLVLAAGTATDPTILTMKGDLAITTVTVSCTLDGATNCNGVEMNPGTVLLIDSDGSGTSYAVGQTTGGNSRWFKADCTDATSMPAWDSGTTYGIGWRVSYGGVNYISTQNSNTGNTPHLFDSAYWQKGNCAVISTGATNAVFSLRGASFGGGNVYFRYVAVKNFGTSSVDAVASRPDTTNNPVGGADIMYSSFRACGAVDLTDGSRTATSVHRFTNNIVVGALSSDSISTILSTSTTAMTSGIREVKENVFENSTVGTTGAGFCYGCTVEGNYVRTSVDGYVWTGGTNNIRLTSLKGNFFYKTSTNNAMTANVPVMEYNYVINGFGITNSRGVSSESSRLAANDSELRYNVVGNLGTDLVGDAVIFAQASNGRTYTATGNTAELNSTNNALGSLLTDLGASSPGGTDNHVYHRNLVLGGSLGLIQVETSVHWAGSIIAQNNTAIRMDGSTMSKVIDTGSCTTNPNDVCSAAGCNYNLGVAVAGTPAAGCTNAHNGYWLDLSAATGWGANDIDLTTVSEAQFADLTRTFATAANEFFGYTATAGAWSGSSVSYAVGDIVSDSQAGLWQGKTVLYRALAAHTSAATTRPGNGATWNTGCSGGPCWEYATGYVLREKIAKGERVTDASIDANNDYPTQAMIKWVLHGRISHRRDLACMGNDGESPWPIPYCERGRTVAAAIMGY